MGMVGGGRGAFIGAVHRGMRFLAAVVESSRRGSWVALESNALASDGSAAVAADSPAERMPAPGEA